MNAVSELSRILPLDRMPPEGIEFTVRALPPEFAGIAARLRVPAVQALECHFRLVPAKGGLPGAVVAHGRLSARLTRECVVSLDPFKTEQTEEFRVHLVVDGSESDELDPDADDEVPYAGDSVDLGELALEQLALVLEPYPRKPGAQLPAEATEEPESPFAALTRLARPT